MSMTAAEAMMDSDILILCCRCMGRDPLVCTTVLYTPTYSSYNFSVDLFRWSSNLIQLNLDSGPGPYTQYPIDHQLGPSPRSWLL